MAATHDRSTDIGKVRTIISDTNLTDAVLQDEDIQVFLDLNNGDLKLAAADALDAMASDQALLLKVVKVLDLQTDGSKVADALRQHADRLRKDGSEDGTFDIAEQIQNGWNFRDLEFNLMLKEL